MVSLLKPVPLSSTGVRAAAPHEPPAAGQIRPLRSDDIPAVAGLFQKTFRDSRQAPPASLRTYLHRLFLEHPWREPDLASRVYVAPGGRIRGFIGILPVRMSFAGKPLRAAVAGSLMVDDPQGNPLAGARLLRTFFDGPQDLSFSETANPISQRMWERLGGRAVAAYSMEWVRVFKPAGFGVAVAAHSFSPARILRPLAALVDFAAERFPRYPLRPAEPDPRRSRDADTDDAELGEAIPPLLSAYALRPDWDADMLRWILEHAAAKHRHGPLFRRMVYGRGGRLLGCYLYYARPGGIAWVLQILAHPDSVDVVIDNLFAHAYAHGSIAVRGRTQPELYDALLHRRCAFMHRSSTVIHSRNPDAINAIRSGDALLVGLAGEAWTQLIGGHFE